MCVRLVVTFSLSGFDFFIKSSLNGFSGWFFVLGGFPQGHVDWRSPFWARTTSLAANRKSNVPTLSRATAYTIKHFEAGPSELARFGPKVVAFAILIGQRFVCFEILSLEHWLGPMYKSSLNRPLTGTRLFGSCHSCFTQPSAFH